VALEKRCEALLPQTARVCRGWVAAQERQRDLPVHRPEHLAGPRPEGGQLIAQLVGQPDPRVHQAIPRSGHRPQRLGLVAVGLEHPEAVAVGARQLGQHEAVKTVALATRNAKPRAHRLDLVGMHRDHRQAGIEQPLDQKPVRSLERDQRHPQTQKPSAQRPDPRLVMPVATTFHDPSPLVDHAHRVLLAGPVHPSELPLLITLTVPSDRLTHNRREAPWRLLTDGALRARPPVAALWAPRRNVGKALV